MTHDERRQRREQIAALVKAGANYASAARKFGVSLATVYAACRELGINRNPEWKPEALALVKDGMALAEAAVEVGISYTQVAIACREAGLKAVRPLLVSTYDIIADLVNTNATLRQIADQRGVTYQRVQQIAARCREAGIRLRRGKGG